MIDYFLQCLLIGVVLGTFKGFSNKLYYLIFLINVVFLLVLFQSGYSFEPVNLIKFGFGIICMLVGLNVGEAFYTEVIK